MKFLKINNGKIEWTETLIQMCNEFRVLFDRDKSENKAVVTNEFVFLYYYCDYRSPYIEFETEARMERAKREGRFPTNWEPDSCVLTAIEKYRELQDGVEVRLFMGIKRSLETASRSVEFTNTRLNKMINVLESFSEDDLLDAEKFAQYNSALDSVSTNIDRILVKAGKLKDNIETLSEVEELIKKAQAENTALAGGKKKGNRMD